jgi:hypothetical protein
MTPEEVAVFAERLVRLEFKFEELEELSVSDLVALNDYLYMRKRSLYEIRQLRHRNRPLIA